MSLEDGKKYNESLIQTSKGELEVDREYRYPNQMASLTCYQIPNQRR
jgi:hypothetical protein